MNYLQKCIDAINKFSDSNTELAQEFCNKLSAQTHRIFMNNQLYSQFDSRKHLVDFIFSDEDVLEQTCEECDADFDYNDARDLQIFIVDQYCDFHDMQ